MDGKVLNDSEKLASNGVNNGKIVKLSIKPGQSKPQKEKIIKDDSYDDDILNDI